MSWIYISLIILWYVLTGIREGLTWSKPATTFIGKSKHHWANYNHWFGGGLFLFGVATLWTSPLTILMVIGAGVWVFSVIGRDTLDDNRTIKTYMGCDYHALRAIEGGAIFALFWILWGKFLLLCGVWLIGNYIYKRFMNKVMYGVWHKISDMYIFWIFGKALPYSDWYYEYSLIPAIYLIIAGVI